MADLAQETQGNTEEQVAGDASTQTQSEAATEEVKAPEGTGVATEDTKAPEGEDTSTDRGLLGEADNSTEGAPESYEDFTFPEGVEVGEDDQNALKEMAKEHGLTQNEAEKAVVLSRDVVSQIAKDEQAQFEQWKGENKTEWESQADHANKTLLASKAVKKLGLDEYMSERGHVYDSKLMGAFAELGRLYSEATHVSGTETAPQSAGRIYDKSPDLYNN